MAVGNNFECAIALVLALVVRLWADLGHALAAREAFGAWKLRVESWGGGASF